MRSNGGFPTSSKMGNPTSAHFFIFCNFSGILIFHLKTRNRKLLTPSQRHGTIGGQKDGGTMGTTNNTAWEAPTLEKKRRALYDRQVATLKTFFEHGAITQAQHNKSPHDLTEKMGYEINE